MKNTFHCEDDDLRIDRFLALKMPDWSRSQLKDLIARGAVQVNGKTVQPDFRLKSGSLVELSLRKEAPASAFGSLKEWLIHEDRDLLVLNKPAGLLMHPLSPTWLSAPAAALETEPSLAAELWSRGPRQRAIPRCGIVHRLDRETSGVLLAAKSPRAFEKLTEDFKLRKIRKVYLAIVRGRPRTKIMRVEAPIGRPPGRKRVVVTALGRASRTEFKVLKSCSSAALVEARPLTGRTHQIRAHLSFLDHPVMGDPDFDLAKQELRPPRLMLHAYGLFLSHPISGKDISFRAPAPDDFKEFWKICLKGTSVTDQPFEVFAKQNA